MTRITVNEKIWERKEQERREEETEKEEMEKFRREKLSILQEEEGPKNGRKRKRGAACMEEDEPRTIAPERHERVVKGLIQY